MKMQIVTILIILMAIIGLSGMTAAQSGGGNNKCKDGNNGIPGTLTVTGGHSDTYNHPGDDKCNNKEDEKKKHKKDKNKDDKREHQDDNKVKKNKDDKREHQDDNDEEDQPA